VGGDDALRDAELLAEENTEPSEIAESVALGEVGMVAGKEDGAPPVVDGDGADEDVPEEAVPAEPPAEAYAESEDVAESVALDDEVGMVAGKANEAPPVVDGD
jgi:hypothetical protein